MQHPLVVSWEDLLPDLKRQVIACLMQNKEMAVIHSLMCVCKETRLLCSENIRTLRVYAPGDESGTWTDFLDAITAFPAMSQLQNLVIDVSDSGEHDPGKGYGGGGFEFGLDSRLIQSLSSFFEFTARFSSKTSLQKITVVKMMLHGFGYEGGRFLILDARFLRALVKALPLLDSFVLVDAECWEHRSGYSISKDFTELKNDTSFTLNVTLPHDAEDEDEEE